MDFQQLLQKAKVKQKGVEKKVKIVFIHVSVH